MRMVEEQQFCLRNGLLREASKSSKGIGFFEGRAIHLRVSNQGLGVIRKGENRRRSPISRQLDGAYSPNGLEAVEVGQEGLENNDPFRAAQSTTLRKT